MAIGAHVLVAEDNAVNRLLALESACAELSIRRAAASR
jgi:hypothetical protein